VSFVPEEEDRGIAPNSSPSRNQHEKMINKRGAQETLYIPIIVVRLIQNKGHDEAMPWHLPGAMHGKSWSNDRALSSHLNLCLALHCLSKTSTYIESTRTFCSEPTMLDLLRMFGFSTAETNVTNHGWETHEQQRLSLHTRLWLLPQSCRLLLLLVYKGCTSSSTC
jgi:hypothetical protein